MSLLQLSAISRQFDGKMVLSDLSLTIHPGEWVGIVGESGSGKSTLLKIIGRFIDADQGSVELKGTPLQPVRDQLIKGHKAIKLVQQDYELFPNQTARENISYALRFYERDYRERKVDELVELTRLSGVQHHKAKLLSGGEKQRTALAQAVAEVPELLLLDEPFAHLDLRNKHNLTEAIEDLKRSHQLTCLFVTHDAGEAMAWADRLIILKEGKIIQEGTPREVYEQPVSVYVAELTGQVNLIPTSISGEWQVIRPNFLRLVKEERKAQWIGRIIKIHFKGGHYEYVCQTTDGQPLIFYRNRLDKKVGDEVLITYSRKHLRNVPG